MREVSDALRAAVAVDLPGARTDDPHMVPELAPDDVAAAMEHRVQGLVWRALETGLVRADDHVRVSARDAQSAALRTCLLAEETCLLALGALGRHGLGARVLKGVASARLDYEDPSHRVFGDADVLVRPDDLSAALDALGREGFERSEPPVRGWWERRFGKSVVLHGPNGGELDLHVRLAAGFFGERIRHDVYWTRSSSFSVAGRPAAGLDPVGRLLNACTHSVLGGRSGLRAQRDVAQLILVTGADWSALADVAVDGGFDVVIARAISGAWHELRLPAGHPAAVWAEGSASDASQVSAIAASNTAGAGWVAEGLGALPAYGWADRTLFLAGLAVPSRASLASRGRTRSDHLSGALRRWNARSSSR